MDFNYDNPAFLESEEALHEYERLLEAMDVGYDLDYVEMDFIEAMQTKILEKREARKNDSERA